MTKKQGWGLKTLLALAVLWCGAALFAVTGTADAQPADDLPSWVTLSDCGDVDETQMKQKVETIYLQSFSTTLTTIDFKQVVDESWDEVGLDQVIEEVVDEAVADAKEKESYVNKLLAGYDPERAEAIGNAIAERVFESARFQTAFETFSKTVSQRVGLELGSASDAARDPALACMHSFLKLRYGQAVAGVVEARVGTSATPQTGPLSPTAFDAGRITLILTGIILIALRGIIRRLIQRIAGRIAAKVLGRFVPVVGWALLAYELLLAPNALIDDIGRELKSEETKDEIRAEVVVSLETEVGAKIPEIARQAADALIGRWVAFRQQNTLVLTLAEDYPAFRQFMGQVTEDHWMPFARAISFLVNQNGREGLLAMLDRGALDPLLSIEDAGVVILESTQSMERYRDWSSCQGGSLARVAELQIHMFVRNPCAVESAYIERLSRASSASVARKLYEVGEADLATLGTRLEGGDFLEVTSRLSVSDLKSMARYLRDLPDSAAQRLVSAVKADPAVFGRFNSGLTRKGIEASRDKGDAVDMVAARSDWWDVPKVMEDFVLVADGRVDIRLFLVSHKLISGVGLLIIVLLLLNLARFLGGGLRIFIRRKEP